MQLTSLICLQCCINRDTPSAASAIALEEGPDYFIYYVRLGETIPWNVTHVRIHSSVRVIKEKAFRGRRQLMIVFLNDGLEEIGECAFEECRSLRSIVIPNAVKTIRSGAFSDCLGLTAITLGDGLEEIGVAAFENDRLLQSVVIPNTVKVIMDHAFWFCSGLTAVTLSDGLEEIGMAAYGCCTSLERIVIHPPSER
jgi:hypothetical protein